MRCRRAAVVPQLPRRRDQHRRDRRLAVPAPIALVICCTCASLGRAQEAAGDGSPAQSQHSLSTVS
eukprot:SAG31_NODE_40357_length_281_cov_0.851648_1_plen_65_part_01